MYCLPHVLVIWLSTAHLCTLSALPSETEYEYPVFFAHLIGLPPKYLLSTACAKLAFCLLVYRVCSLFVLPSETEHQHWVAFAHQTGPPPEYNEINAGTHVCAILSGRPLVVPRWTLFLGWSSGCLGWPSGMILECFLGCPHVSTFPMREIARAHLYNNICLMCPPTPQQCALLSGRP